MASNDLRYQMQLGRLNGICNDFHHSRHAEYFTCNPLIRVQGMSDVPRVIIASKTCFNACHIPFGIRPPLSKKLFPGGPVGKKTV